MPYRETAQIRARKDEVRQSIVDAARGLVAESGFRAAQMSAVAARAGIATGTTYRYFPTQIDLFAEVFRANSQREVDAMREAAAGEGGCAERLRRALYSFIERALRGRRLAYALIAEPVDPRVEAQRLEYRGAYAAVLEALLEEGIAAGEFAAQDPRISAAALVGVLGETLLGPLLRSGPTARESAADSIVALCLRAAGAPANGAVS